MVENVNAVAGAAIDLQDYAIPASEPPSGELGKDAFLKLLVAQLKYQDPLEPSTSEEFIATTAQFTVVEKLDELTKQGANTALVNALTTASTLVGREIAANRGGLPVKAIVEHSRIESGAVVLETDQGSVDLSDIVSIGPAPNGPSPAAVEPPAEPEPDAGAGTATTATAAVAELPVESPVEPEPDAGAGTAATATAAVAELPVESPVVADPVEPLTEQPPVPVTPAVQAEQVPLPAVPVVTAAPVVPAPSAVPVVPISSTTPSAVEDADHAESEPFDPFDREQTG